jgi:hypothetical protein
MTQFKQWQGLRALIEDAIEHGSRAIERVHMETARRPFTIIEHIPVVAAPARAVHLAHDTLVSTTYAAVRLANRTLSVVLCVALDTLDAKADALASADDQPSAEA